MLEQILCYLERAPGRRILYNNHAHTCIACFADADWVESKIEDLLLRTVFLLVEV